MPFLQTPVDFSGMGSFLQESVGHGEVLCWPHCCYFYHHMMCNIILCSLLQQLLWGVSGVPG